MWVEPLITFDLHVRKGKILDPSLLGQPLNSQSDFGGWSLYSGKNKGPSDLPPIYGPLGQALCSYSYNTECRLSVVHVHVQVEGDLEGD